MIKAKEKIIWHKEAGMAVLSLVLLLVMIGGLALPPLLSLMMTGMKAGQMEERKTKQFYAADAGVNASLWRIQNIQLPTTPHDLNEKYWDESFYTSAYGSYTLGNIGTSDNINDNVVVYQIKPKWILEGIETPNTTQKRTPVPPPAAITVSGLQIIGNPDNRGSYKIIIKYNDSAGGLGISRIGCWLPAGYEYVLHSSSLETLNKPYTKVPVVTPFRGGHTVTWNYSPPLAYNSFDPAGTQREVTFQFTPDRKTQSEFCWLSDNLTASDKYLAWTNMKLFDITSTATDNSSQSTTIVAMSNRNDATPDQEGDYYAFGSTLMRSSDNTTNNYRERVYDNTTVTVTDMPAGAHIEQALLYWSGWKCKPWDVRTGYDQTALNNLPVTNKVDQVKLKVTASGFTTLSKNVPAGASKIQGAISKRGTDAMGWCYSCAADITSDINAMGADFTGNGTYTVGHYNVGSYDNTLTPPRIYPLWGWVDGHPTTGANAERVSTYTAYPLGSPSGTTYNGVPSYGGCYKNTTNCSKDEGGVAAAGSTTSSCVNSCGSGYVNYQHDAAYSAWSIVLIYTDPYTRGHQIFVSDNFTFILQNNTPGLDRPISGFTVPELIAGEKAAKYTHFVGEGDKVDSDGNYKDWLYVKGATQTAFTELGDPTGGDNPKGDICNNQSRIPPGPTGKLIDGIDIDTFDIPQGVVVAGDTKATMRFVTGQEGLNLIYMIVSFRSKLDTGGADIYYIQ